MYRRRCWRTGSRWCRNDPSVVCELDIQCGSCAANSPTPGVTCIADKQCGGVCSNDSQIVCQTAGDCGGTCREDGVTPCATDDDCDFGCQLINTCNFFSCETKTCTAAKCVPANTAMVPKNVGANSKFLNPMVTVHWNGDHCYPLRQRVEVAAAAPEGPRRAARAALPGARAAARRRRLQRW